MEYNKSYGILEKDTQLFLNQCRVVDCYLVIHAPVLLKTGVE